MKDSAAWEENCLGERAALTTIALSSMTGIRIIFEYFLPSSFSATASFGRPTPTTEYGLYTLGFNELRGRDEAQSRRVVVGRVARTRTQASSVGRADPPLCSQDAVSESQVCSFMHAPCIPSYAC